jgi:hypothetical protein
METISRQDMAVLTVRALEKYRGFESSAELAVLDPFGDRADIADYAEDCLAALVENGLLIGDGTNLNPPRRSPAPRRPCSCIGYTARLTDRVRFWNAAGRSFAAAFKGRERSLQHSMKPHESVSLGPPTAGFRRNGRVAGLAQRHQVVFIVSAALAEREDVVHLLGDPDEAKLFAYLAERVLGYVPVTDPPPLAGVPHACFRVALKFVVLSMDDTLMLRQYRVCVSWAQPG